MKHTPTPSVMAKLAALAGILAITSTSAVSARVLFQNDTEFLMDADNLVINADNDVTTGQLYLKFNNSSTPGENGYIYWDIDDEKFVIDDDIDINGNLTLTGEVDASTAASFRIREVADVIDGTTTCTYANEIALDTGEGALYMCTAPAPTNTWIKASATASVISGAADPATPCTVGDLFYNITDEELKYCAGATWETVGPQDFEQVFATDADGILTTGNQSFGIDTGTADFNVTNSGLINFDTGTFDLDATTITVDATDLTFTGNNITFTADNWSITSAGVATFDSVDTGDLTSDGVVDFSAATSVRTREVADITTAACTAVGELVLDTSTDRLYTCTAIGAPGTFASLGGANVSELTYNVEYPNAVVNAQTGTNNNKGTLSTIFDSASARQHYRWVTTQNTLQDLELRLRVELPADFSSFDDLELDYRTNSATTTDNRVNITVRDITNLASPVTCATVTDLASATWATNTITAATLNGGSCGGGISEAGSILEVVVNLASRTNTNFADAGQLRVGYSN